MVLGKNLRSRLRRLRYLPGVSVLESQMANHPALNQVAVPDLWQQQAVAALREGNDVVVQAPTGAGKTLIFELWSNAGKPRGQAIYTVPTRALANDKLAEWRARGWDVGIATGDLAENLRAPILVATLETQKHRLIAGDGPALLVVDEYQMLGDADRGLNYELALALAPAHTQLLLLSGSVANPHHVVQWLTRLGRKAVLIRHEQHALRLVVHELPRPVRGIDANRGIQVVRADRVKQCELENFLVGASPDRHAGRVFVRLGLGIAFVGFTLDFEKALLCIRRGRNDSWFGMPVG